MAASPEIPDIWNKRFISMPVWAFHGDQDTICSLKNDEEMINALRAQGALPRFTSYQARDTTSAKKRTTTLNYMTGSWKVLVSIDLLKHQRTTSESRIVRLWGRIRVPALGIWTAFLMMSGLMLKWKMEQRLFVEIRGAR
jgi:hypothetical protein